LNRKAPGVRLAIQSLRWEEVENGLASGAVDIAMGSLPMIKGRVHARTVRKDRFFTIMRREHHMAQRKLDLAKFAEAEHLVIDAASSGHALVEGVL
ncbi:LysR family transcriptional regulator, partial [Pseudomonas sp. GW460-13]